MTISFVAGILVGDLFGVVLPLVLISAGVVLGLILRYTPAVFVLVSAMAGLLDGWAHNPPSLPDTLFESEYSFSGTVTEEREGESTRHIIVKVDSIGDEPVTPFRISVNIASHFPTVYETDRIRFTARADRLLSMTDLPDEFDYSHILLNKGVVASAFIRPEAVGHVIRGDSFIRKLLAVRHEIISAIAATGLDAEAKDFLITILTGDDSFISDSTRQLYSNAGVAHVLALSGLHVAIITIIISLMLSPLVLLHMRKTKIVITIAVLWLFAAMTGLSPSVVRAVIMATVFMISLLIERTRAPFNSLSIAALLILLFDPRALWSAGFQLSFIAVIFILLLGDKLNPFHRRSRILHTAAGYVTVSLAAMLGTGIVSAYYFHIFPVYFLLANVVTTLLLPFILAAGIIVVALMAFFGAEFTPLTSLLDLLCHAVAGVNSFIVSLPGATVTGLFPSLPCIILFYIATAFFILWLYTRRRHAVTGMLVSVVAMVIAVISEPAPATAALYMPRSHDNTMILIPDSTSLTVMTTAPAHRYEELAMRCRSRYSAFMMRRGIEEIQVSPLPREIIARDMRIYFVSKSSDTIPSGPVEICVFTDRFKGDILSTAASVNARRNILGSSINRRRHDRYYRELTSAALPVTAHRDTTISIP